MMHHLPPPLLWGKVAREKMAIINTFGPVLTRVITERDHTPTAHCHRAGFGHRIEIGLVRVAPHKIVSTDRRTDGRTDGHENRICTTSYTHKHYV